MKGKCPNCGSEFSMGWSETICPKCGRHFISLKTLLILFLLLFLALAVLSVSYFAENDLLDSIVIPSVWIVLFMAIIIDTAITSRKNKSLTLVQEKPKAK
jgi:hypothetical protein